jgi:hypothetical protein
VGAQTTRALVFPSNVGTADPAAFLAALPSLGVTAAAREAGVAEFTPCKWYANDARFRAAWDALEPLTV